MDKIRIRIKTFDEMISLHGEGSEEIIEVWDCIENYKKALGEYAYMLNVSGNGLTVVETLRGDSIFLEEEEFSIIVFDVKDIYEIF